MALVATRVFAMAIVFVFGIAAAAPPVTHATALRWPSGTHRRQT